MANLISASEAIVNQLATYLQSAMPELAQVLEDWPAASQVLKYPSLTIFSNKPTLMNLMPYELSRSAPDLQNRTVVKWIVGEYDFKLQLDLWAASKKERNDLYDLFFQKFNRDINPMGLGLQLEKYHGIWCRYDMTGYSFEDGEAASQRREWRAKIDIVANCRAILEQTLYAMKVIETDVETPDTI